MHLFPSFFPSVVAAVLASEASQLSSLKQQTMQMQVTGAHGTTTVKSFHPESLFETFGVEGLDHPLSAQADFRLEDAAVSFVQSRLNVASGTVAYTTGYSNDVVQHAYIHQQINGIPVTNAVANVAFDKANKVVSFGSSFVKPSNVPSTVPSISAADAISKAENELGGKYNGHPTKIEYVAKQDGSISLTHAVQIRDDSKAMWYEAFVDAHTGDIVQLIDFVAHASYRVLPITKQNILQGFETLTDPQNLASSPLGWHSDNVTSTIDTSGNNVVTYVHGQQCTTAQSSVPLNFDYVHNATQNPEALQANIDAARVNTFYLVNTVHDISYQYGFTEAAFNFQNNNFGNGGLGNDRVEVSVHDGPRKNNAIFSTPPDGQPGVMQMFIFDRTNPERDSSLENDVIVHEYTHGITNRMTGGGTARCLMTLEAKGLGEGWSDALAEWMTWTNSTITDRVIGAYVTNNTAGIRTHPYSTNATTNPLMYSNLWNMTGQHRIGEVWANMLHNVYAQLVAEHGFSATAKTDANTTGGNTVYLHLFIDALALQPCNPTFINARDAWIQADASRYRGTNRCTLWRTFASRGLGVGAANYADSASVPAGC